MVRDVDRLTSRTFDVLVVGGGILGLAVVYDAALRGLAVGLIEREDFGSGSSFNHLRTIHGGLRYLQTLNLTRARASIRERRTLALIAPHAVQPLSFVLPLYRSATKGKAAFAAGLLLDRLVACDRNRGVPPSHRLPGGRILSRREAANRFPDLGRQGLTGAAVWWDYETMEADRLTLSFGLAAAERGATLANYVEAVSPLAHGAVVTGVRARDRHSGRELEIAAHVTVNATGSSINRLPAAMGVAARVPFLRAMNLVTSRAAGGRRSADRRRRGGISSSCRGAGARCSAPGNQGVASPRGTLAWRARRRRAPGAHPRPTSAASSGSSIARFPCSTWTSAT